jgi:hypothetical protein
MSNPESLKNHYQNLVNKHYRLEKNIEKDSARHGSHDNDVSKLKKEKLAIKEEMEKMEKQNPEIIKPLKDDAA